MDGVKYNTTFKVTDLMVIIFCLFAGYLLFCLPYRSVHFNIIITDFLCGTNYFSVLGKNFSKAFN